MSRHVFALKDVEHVSDFTTSISWKKSPLSHSADSYDCSESRGDHSFVLESNLSTISTRYSSFISKTKFPTMADNVKVALTVFIFFLQFPPVIPTEGK